MIRFTSSHRDAGVSAPRWAGLAVAARALLLGLFPSVLGRLMMTDDAASTGAENAVMAGIVPGDFADGGALQAACRLRGAATQPAAIKKATGNAVAGQHRGMPACQRLYNTVRRWVRDDRRFFQACVNFFKSLRPIGFVDDVVPLDVAASGRLPAHRCRHRPGTRHGRSQLRD
jgi:hypothetical protein